MIKDFPVWTIGDRPHLPKVSVCRMVGDKGLYIVSLNLKKAAQLLFAQCKAILCWLFLHDVCIVWVCWINTGRFFRLMKVALHRRWHLGHTTTHTARTLWCPLWRGVVAPWPHWRHRDSEETSLRIFLRENTATDWHMSLAWGEAFCRIQNWYHHN